jgi:hypothetical protein
MDPSYQNVVDPGDLVFTLIAYALHGVAVAAQLGLTGFLIFTGLHSLLRPGAPSRWGRRLGATPAGAAGRRSLALLRMTLGLGLLLPLLLGVPWAVSLLSAVAALVLGVASERAIADAQDATGRWARALAISAATVAALFMTWEREDNLALGVDLLVSATQSRNEELGWQLETDPAAPKVGDLAPDFELQDPEGQVRVRLSDFRGKRPVALVFGSYT